MFIGRWATRSFVPFTIRSYDLNVLGIWFGGPQACTKNCGEWVTKANKGLWFDTTGSLLSSYESTTLMVTHKPDWEMGRTEVVYESVICYPILAIIGVPANLMSVVILSRGKCVLSKGITRYMVAMAIADLLVCIFNVSVESIFRYHFPNTFLNYTYTCRFSAIIQVVSPRLSIWFTLAFTFDRFITICCQKLKLKYCTERNAAIVITVVCVLSILINIPVYFRYEPYYIVDDIQWGCRTATGYFYLPAWITYKWISTLSSPLLPFLLLLVLNILTARHILVASRSRRALKSQSIGENKSDPEMKSRRRSIILLFSVSGSLILLSAPITVIHISVGVTETANFQGSSSFYSAIRITLLLYYLSSCTNTCIYALTQRRFREEMKNTVKYPFTLILTLFK
ncbi:probable G-protein coupled receptor 139 [Heptranchias perlo]|uniref:probable G-protein coupled receptor 139 n=1 Tax=Heptranchias perlo TaxID=212740 RepID=UPI003559DBC6